MSELDEAAQSQRPVFPVERLVGLLRAGCVYILDRHVNEPETHELMVQAADMIERLRAVADQAAHALAHAQMWVDNEDTEMEMIDAMRAVNDVLQPNAQVQPASCPEKSRG